LPYRQKQIVTLDFCGCKRAVGQGEQWNMGTGLPELASEMDALLRGERVAGDCHGRSVQLAETGELVCQLRLGPCGDSLKASEIQDFATVGEKRFIVSYAQECGPAAFTAGCGTGAELRLGLHTMPF
jgi:hypothetical protein